MLGGACLLGFFLNLTESVGIRGAFLALLLTMATIAGFAFLVRARRLAREERARLERQVELVHRFGEDVAARILTGTLWQGASEAMIFEMMGDPSDVKSTVLHGQSAAAWTYGSPLHGNYVRVLFANGECVGWESERNELTTS